MQKLECLQELLGKITDAMNGKRVVFLALEEIVQGRSEAFKDHAIVSLKGKCVVHDGAVRHTPLSTQIHVLDNVGLDFGRIVVSLDVADNLDGHNVVRVVLPLAGFAVLGRPIARMWI